MLNHQLPNDADGDQYAVLILNRDQIAQLLIQDPRRVRLPANHQLRSASRPMLPVGQSSTRAVRSRRVVKVVVAAVTIMVAGASAWAWVPRPVLSIFEWHEPAAPMATSASFSVVAASHRDAAAAAQMVKRFRVNGISAFAYAASEESAHQVLVGPFVSLDEAESQRRRLGLRGFWGTRMFVDESLRRTTAAAAEREDPLNPGVVLIGAPGRVSLVVEMPETPRRIVARRLEETLEIDIGPLLTTVDPQTWSAPADVDLFRDLAIAPMSDERGRTLARAMLTVPDGTHAATRVEGRRLYIDLTTSREQPVSSPRPAREAVPSAGDRAASAHLGSGVRRTSDSSGSPSGVAPRSSRTSPAETAHTSAASPAPDNTAAIAIARVDRLLPFLRSAAGSPSPEVMAALTATIAEIDALLHASGEGRGVTDLRRAVSASLTAARRTVDPRFAGDRTAEALQAQELLEAAKQLARP